LLASGAGVEALLSEIVQEQLAAFEQFLALAAQDENAPVH
jgi:hypothetical protein